MNNIPNYYNNIDLILDEIWSLLQRGVADRNEDFRLPVVIVSSIDSAEGRVVVLRGAFKDKNILRFHTDFRSSKIKSLMENRYKTMIQGKFDFGFAVDWMRKDLGIAMDEAKNNGSDLPITKIIDGYYSEVQKNSGNRFDTSSLITRLKKNK